MEDKTDRILNLLSERSRYLHEEIDSYRGSEDEDAILILEINSAQIVLLDELYQEIKSLK